MADSKSPDLTGLSKPAQVQQHPLFHSMPWVQPRQNWIHGQCESGSAKRLQDSKFWQPIQIRQLSCARHDWPCVNGCRNSCKQIENYDLHTEVLNTLHRLLSVQARNSFEDLLQLLSSTFAKTWLHECNEHPLSCRYFLQSLGFCWVALKTCQKKQPHNDSIAVCRAWNLPTAWALMHLIDSSSYDNANNNEDDGVGYVLYGWPAAGHSFEGVDLRVSNTITLAGHIEHLFTWPAALLRLLTQIIKQSKKEKAIHDD